MQQQKPAAHDVLRSVLWPMLACVIAAVTIDYFHRQDDASRQLVAKASDLHSAAYRVHLLGADALPAVETTMDVKEDADSFLETMRDRLHDAKTGGLSPEDAKNLSSVVDSFEKVERDEFDLIEAGRMQEALQLDGTRVDAAFERVQVAIASAQAHVDAAASKSNSVASVATFGSMVLCMVVVVFSTQRQHARSKKEQEGRAKALEEAENANRQKNDFLSRMSHELRTPMNAILGFGQVLEMEQLDPSQQLAVEQILVAGKHLLGLINEVLDIARIEAGTIGISAEPVSAKHVVEECLSLVAPLAQARGIRVTTHWAHDENTWVVADKQRLRQCLLNLFSNAIKYNLPNGTVDVFGKEENGQWRIEVKDSGIGIPEKALNRLFTPFDRLGAECTPTEGTGLGLALSQRMMAHMGGELNLVETGSHGSTFAIQLALAKAPIELTNLESDGANPVAGSHVHKVLYIEDNPGNLLLMCTLMAKHAEYSLETAMSGSVGLELAQAHIPDLIILDLHLPDMEGDAVLARLQSNPETTGIPVVVLSADASPGQMNRLIARGAAAYLTKPLDAVLLFETLAQHLVQGECRAA